MANAARPNYDSLSPIEVLAPTHVGKRRKFGVLWKPEKPGVPTRDPAKCAAQYVRMSTDHQVYSTANQMDAIADFARTHGLEIVKTYADEGKSGLRAVGRPGLCLLLEDVASRRAEYRTILVYDVSRWGRFQDTDEAAHYEYLCRRAGIQIEYCMEPFRNDCSPMSSVVKGLKRVMAGEYSRELSVKVYAGKVRASREGFSSGGSAVYGLRRVLVDNGGVRRAVLERGEQKCVQSHRVAIEPGPKSEQRIVRWVFRQLVDHGVMPTAIAESLNRRGILTASGGRWKRESIVNLLTNEKYIGNVTYSRTSARLGTPFVRRPPEQWIRTDGVIKPIIDRKLFEAARKSIAGWSTRISNESALEALKALFLRRGTLSEKIINSEKDIPGSAFYNHRFGGLLNAYRAVGFCPTRNYEFVPGFAVRCQKAVDARVAARNLLIEMGAEVRQESKSILVVNERVRVAVMAARRTMMRGAPRWMVQLHVKPPPQFVLVARLEADTSVKDYFLVPGGPLSFLMGVVHRYRKEPRDRRQALSMRPLLDLIMQAATA